MAVDAIRSALDAFGVPGAQDARHVLEKMDAVGQDLFAAPDAPVAGHQNVDVELAEGAKRL